MNIPDLAGATEKRDGAYEIKFVVSTSVAEAVLAWARFHLAPDPHANSPNGDGYHVNSLYFDTPGLDVYLRNGSYGRSKYRVRRYGSEANIFLERKLKKEGIVTKRRTRIPDDDLLRLAAVDPDAEWAGSWFRRRLFARRLLPQCQIKYERVARVGAAPEGPIRLTVDREVQAFRTTEYDVVEQGTWMPLLPERCILELKFRLVIPPLFKSLLEELALTPQPMSKYRASIQAFGLDAASKNGDPVQNNGHASVETLRSIAQPTQREASASPREA